MSVLRCSCAMSRIYCARWKWGQQKDSSFLVAPAWIHVRCCDQETREPGHALLPLAWASGRNARERKRRGALRFAALGQRREFPGGLAAKMRDKMAVLNFRRRAQQAQGRPGPSIADELRCGSATATSSNGGRCIRPRLPVRQPQMKYLAPPARLRPQLEPTRNCRAYAVAESLVQVLKPVPITDHQIETVR